MVGATLAMTVEVGGARVAPAAEHERDTAKDDDRPRRGDRRDGGWGWQNGRAEPVPVVAATGQGRTYRTSGLVAQ